MATENGRVRVAILGASGYTGAELVRILVRHPRVEIVLLTADRRAGQGLGEVFPHLGGLGLPGMLSLDQVEWSGLDIGAAFCALPHGTSQAVVAGLLHSVGDSLVDELIAEAPEDLINAAPGGVKVFDLSADFRLQDAEVYREWYGVPHRATALLPRAVYGLTEFARGDVADADLVACPGCYPTATLLPLVPLLQEALILPYDIIVDAKSGVSGAGRAEKEANLFAEVSEGIHAYGVARHRHAPEIEQSLSVAASEPVTISFTPHLVPMNRGILATAYVRLSDGAGAGDLRRSLVDRYRGEPFVQVLDEGRVPATRMVRGSNQCVVNVFEDRAPGRAIVISAIDNLVKGASGQAVQNFNVAFGFAETLGLDDLALFP